MLALLVSLGAGLPGARACDTERTLVLVSVSVRDRLGELSF